ncbi:hypothetical protein ACF3N7_00680 [Cruoricaptor ignavus]|uniref:hypothetical protein n=1 Tax=Cruoricaptor ignavus TaxID=1118202 RepID=UPI00370D62E2
MDDIDLLHFEQLKKEIQDKYLENHSPSDKEISKWKGIDIIYFQEELRRIAKGSISEKSFYTYFKTSPVSKLPRIDLLNILSIYAGYASWYDFKKQHLFADEILNENDEDITSEELDKEIAAAESEEEVLSPDDESDSASNIETKREKSDIQFNYTENQAFVKHNENQSEIKIKHKKSFKDHLWWISTILAAVLLGILIFQDEIFRKKYTYRFIDADRNSLIADIVEVKILRPNDESPILVKLQPKQEFTYNTKAKELKMVVSSTFYKEKEIYRNLENAPRDETIELQPNDYAQMLYYYSRSIKDLKKKRQELERLIANNALIYQVFDSEQYGVETMDKQRYISLVTLPTTSLENLDVISTQTDAKGKINMIKFRILKTDEKPAE